jgi:tetratricopeptide (TPR) repeat protein
MPRLRVLLFGYNSSAVFQTSTVGVAGAANNLLDQLRFQRREHPNRPIVFVCHSLGGVVCKQALVEAHNANEVHGPILKYTRGIAFFGTPHSGGHGARLGDSIVRVLHAVTGNVRNDIMEWLRSDSFLSNHLAENFVRRAKNMRIVSFMENLPISRHFGLVVPRSSSSLNWPAETRVLMEATHTTICKFSSQEDDLYIRVADHMLDLIVWAAQRPEMSIPRISISRESLDIPPPPYALELTSSIDHLIHSESQEVSGKLPTEDTSDSEDIPAGWLSRVRAASPFRAPSPRPAYRSRASSSSDEGVPLEVTTPVWPIVMTPYPRNPHYVHRSEIWNHMLSAMNKGVSITLQGIGGCGKTQVAVYLTHWFRDKNPDGSIMWINATLPDTALAGLGMVASRLTIKNTDGEEQRLLTLKDKLERPNSGRWLMIFDAADSLDTYNAVEGFLPRCTNGQVLFTSRRNLSTRDPAMQDFVFELSKLSAFEGAALVHMSMKDNLLANIDPPDMDRLLRKLDYLALAVAQAVAFMNSNAMSLKLYLTKISDENLFAEQLSQNSISEDYISGMAPAVYSTFKLSLERIASEQPEAIRILGCLSFLQSRRVPADLVNLLISLEALNDQPVTELKDYSFIQWSEGNTSLIMKRLVLVATQKWLQETDRSEILKASMLRIISDNFPDAAMSTSWARCESWLPHALKMIDTCQEDADTASVETPRSGPSRTGVMNLTERHRAIAQLKAKVGLYFHKIGQWNTAREYLEEALQISRQNFGTMDDLTLSTQATLIQTSRYLGKIRTACENARDLKRARKAKLGKRDKDTLDSYRIYALTLQDLGKWKNALHASEKGLAGYRYLYRSDPTNPEILRLCRRTSNSYRMLGQYARAETLLREAIEGYKRRDEETSEPAVDCLFGLALLQCHMKRFHEAEATSRECLRLRKCFMKSSHPDVLKTVWLVGVTLNGQHRWSEAESLFTKVLEQARNRPGVGNKHMYTLQVLYCLGSLKEERAIQDEAMLGPGAGRDGLHKARVILDEVLVGRMETFGSDHLETLTARARLAGIHCALGENDGAGREAQEVLNVVTNKEYRRLGVASAAIAWMCLSTLTSCAFAKARKLKGLPGNEQELKELRRLAMSCAKQMAEAMDKTLGKQHPDTLDAARVWAEALYAAGDFKTATKVTQRFGTTATGSDDFTAVRYKGLPSP